MLLAGAGGVLSAFAFVSVFPLWAVALGPLLWGIPHVLSDLRYLVLREGHHRSPLRAALFVLAAGLGLTPLGLGGALLGCAALALSARSNPWRRLAVLAALLALALACVASRGRAELAFVHLHNAVALLLWALWRRKRDAVLWVVLGLTAAGAVACLAGLPAALGRWASPWPGLTASALAPDLVPVEGAAQVERWITLYAFGQAVHYLAWMRLLPEEDAAQEGPRSFVQSARSLLRDAGSWVVGLCALLTAGLFAWGLADAARARGAYLWLTGFHGYVELAALSLWLAGEPRRGGAS